jgi:hypothetical protein
VSDVVTALTATCLIAFYMVLEWKLIETYWIWSAMK